MESVEGCPDDTPWDCNTVGGSYFRIADLHTGSVVSYVQESVGHAFFSAVVDDKYQGGTVWV